MDTRYQINEAALDLPTGFEDQSVNIFRQSKERGLAFVVIRDGTESGDTIDSYAARQLKSLASSLGHFKLLKREHCQVDHRSAICFEISWVAAEGLLFQRQAMFLHHERAIIITATEPGPVQPENEIIWRRLLASISVRR